MEKHQHRWPHLETPKVPTPLEDMQAIASEILGPQFDEEGRSRWELKEDQNSLSGYAVTDDGNNYFIYGRSVYPNIFGLKRVRFGEDGRIASISSQAIRSAEEEYRRDDTA